MDFFLRPMSTLYSTKSTVKLSTMFFTSECSFHHFISISRFTLVESYQQGRARPQITYVLPVTSLIPEGSGTIHVKSFIFFYFQLFFAFALVRAGSKQIRVTHGQAEAQPYSKGYSLCSSYGLFTKFMVEILTI